MQGIWRFPQLSKMTLTQLTLGEGDTPLLSVELNGKQVYLKDENKNPNGSFKDRSLAWQLSDLIDEKKDQFVISSSGNAAISAAAYCSLAKLKLTVFVSTHINPEKLAKLEKFASDLIVIKQVARPKSDAIMFAKETGAINLRGSADPRAQMGFKSIAYELLKQLPGLDAIFIPCSSGTSALAIAKGFAESGRQVKIHICQTTKIHPIASLFDGDFEVSKTSKADAISDRVALLKDELVEMITASMGAGWVISDAELTQARADLSAAGDEFANYSDNSLLAVAGYQKSIANGKSFEHPVLLMSGL